MTLTFTLGASVLTGASDEPSDALMYATISCNVAWAIIDTALLLCARMFERSRIARLGDLIRHSRANEDVIPSVANELDGMLATIVPERTRQTLYSEIVDYVRKLPSRKVRLTRADAYAAVAVFMSVFVATLPATLPYLVIGDPMIALRISNALQIAVLFWVGFHWAGYTRVNPWIAGASVTLIGISLVAVAMALGG